MTKATRTKNSILNLVTSLGGQLLITVLKFITRTVFIHTLGKQYLGINGLFSNILTMLSLTELGLDTAIHYKLYKPLAEKDEKRVRILMKFYKQAYRVIGCAIFFLGLGLIPLLPLLIKNYESLALLGINATLIFMLYLLQSVSSYLFFAYRSAVMKANQKKYVLDIADCFVTIATNITQVLILIYLKTFILYTATVIFFNIFKNLINAIISQKYYPHFFIKEPESLTKEEIAGLFKDCGALFIYKVNNVVLKATDNLVISKFIGLSAVGLYSNYLLFYTTLRSLLNKVLASYKASLGNLFATESLEKCYRFFEIINFLTVVLYGTAAVGVSVCANELVQVWVSADYVVPQPLPILIGIELLFVGINYSLGQIRNISGAFRQLWYRPLMGIIINIVVSVSLVQVCGIDGVVVGTIASLVLTTFLVDPQIIHKYSFRNFRPASEYYKKNIKYFLLLSLICVGDMLFCNSVFVGFGWFSVIFHIFIVCVTVPGVFILVYHQTHECQYLFKMVQRVFLAMKKKLTA